MDECLVQNMMNTFSEARYYLNVIIMVMFDHHSNIIAVAVGLETLLPSKNAMHTTQSRYIGTI